MPIIIIVVIIIVVIIIVITEIIIVTITSSTEQPLINLCHQSFLSFHNYLDHKPPVRNGY